MRVWWDLFYRNHTSKSQKNTLKGKKSVVKAYRIAYNEDIARCGAKHLREIKI